MQSTCSLARRMVPCGTGMPLPRLRLSQRPGVRSVPCRVSFRLQEWSGSPPIHSPGGGERDFIYIRSLKQSYLMQFFFVLNGLALAVMANRDILFFFWGGGGIRGCRVGGCILIS